MAKTRSQKLLIASSILAVLSFLVHTIMGTSEIQGPLLDSNLSEILKVILYVCWHIVSITLFAFTWILFKLRNVELSDSTRMVLRTLGVCWIAFGLLFPTVAFWIDGIHFILRFPQVLLLTPTGILCYLGSKK